MPVAFNPQALLSLNPSDVVQITDSTGAKTKSSTIISIAAVGLAVFLLFFKKKKRRK